MKTKHLLLVFVSMFVFGVNVNAAPKKDSSKTVTFDVSMHCQSCVNRIQKEVSFEKGVKDLDINLEEKTVKVTYDSLKINVNTLKKSIEDLGYEVNEKK